MFEGIICCKPRAKDRRAQGMMSGTDGSNHLGRKQCQPLRSEHLVSAEPGPTEATARRDVEARTGKPPVFPGNLKNQSADLGVRGSHLVPHTTRETFLWRLQVLTLQ